MSRHTTFKISLSNDSNHKISIESGESRFIQCSEIADDAQRLACYDKLAKELLEEEKEEELEKEVPAGWQYSETTYPVDDSLIQNLSVRSDERVNGAYPQLIIRHALHNKFVLLDIPFMSWSREVRIHHRLDNSLPTRLPWQLIPNSEYLAYPYPGRFIRSMYNKQTLMLHLNLPSETLTLHFQISGLREAIRPMAKGWLWGLDWLY